MATSDPSAAVIVKIGGSTCGASMTLRWPISRHWRSTTGGSIVVHGGGATITKWLDIHGTTPHISSTVCGYSDSAALEVVVAVLAGLINKQIVADLAAGCSSARD